MATQAPVAVDERHTAIHFDRSSKKAADAAEQADVFHDTVTDCALHFERAQNTERVEAARGIVKELLALEADIKAHAAAFGHLSHTHRPTIDSNTDFAALVEQRCADHPVECEPEEEERFREFQQKVWEVHHAGQPMPGGSAAAARNAANEDDDIILEAGAAGSDLAKNTRCPISGTEVLDLKDPVEDQLGFVYERAAIEDWFRHQDGRGDTPVDAPFAAVNHTISKETLKKAARVIREQRRRARRGTQAQPAQAEEDVILDV